MGASIATNAFRHKWPSQRPKDNLNSSEQPACRLPCLVGSHTAGVHRAACLNFAAQCHARSRPGGKLNPFGLFPERHGHVLPVAQCNEIGPARNPLGACQGVVVDFVRGPCVRGGALLGCGPCTASRCACCSRSHVSIVHRRPSRARRSGCDEGGGWPTRCPAHAVCGDGPKPRRRYALALRSLARRQPTPPAPATTSPSRLLPCPDPRRHASPGGPDLGGQFF